MNQIITSPCHHQHTVIPAISQVFQEFAQQNQLLLNAAGEGIYGVDAEGRATFVNPAAERILGWKADELLGKNIHLAIHHSHTDGSDYCVQDCPIFAAFRDGTVRRVDDEVFWCCDGHAVPVEYTSTPVYDQEKLMGAVVIFRDVSERKSAEAKLHSTMEELREALEQVKQLTHKLELENAYLQQEISEGFNSHHIVGNSAVVQQIDYQIKLVAPTIATVLITGESGTGKELIARAIHRASERNQRPLIRVNCAAIPPELFESEFFGHVRGAFSGAVNARLGRFEVADGGTLFLDEIGELPIALQGKLLRVLQDGEFERVGESITRKVDVRVIAATNRNLKHLVDQGLFREDLYFRLNVFPIRSAPLRERLEDIPLLVAHFLKATCQRFHKPTLKVSLGQIQRLQEYPWPGNIRELENRIERQVILSLGDKLVLDDFPLTSTPAVKQLPQGAECLTEESVKNLQYQATLDALRKADGKIYGAGGAANILGIKPTTLASRIKKWGLDKKPLSF
ncbi:sigma-54 interaction domain-containing protein [Cellvibrio sp.]